MSSIAHNFETIVSKVSEICQLVSSVIADCALLITYGYYSHSWCHLQTRLAAGKGVNGGELLVGLYVPAKSTFGSLIFPSTAG